MKERKFDLIIFDFDGVLVEFRWEWIYEAYLAVLKSEGIDPNKFFKNLDEFKDGSWGGNNDGRSNFKILGVKDTKKAYEIYYDSYNQHIQVLPHVKNLLNSLLKAGYFLAVVTNRHAHNATDLLGPLSFYFDAIVGAEDVKKFKPDPEGINIVLKEFKQFNVRKERTVIIGDSPYDIKAGKLAKIKTAAVIWEYGAHDVAKCGIEESDFTIETAEDFYNLFL